MSSRTTAHHRAGRGILMALLATVAYAVVDTLSKYQAREYPVGMIVWARYAVPLALLLAVIFLGEKVSPLGWTAVLLGFSGVLIIVRPGGGLFTPAAFLPLGLALCFSSYQFFTRLIAGKENSLNSLFCVLLVGTVAMSAALPLAWVAPTLKGLVLFLLIGVTSGIGHFTMIKALEYAPASLIAPFAYIQLLWVGILGALVFGDFPDAVTLAGMAVVVAGGLLVAASRRREAIAARSPAVVAK